jgi:hypothetical protein
MDVDDEEEAAAIAAAATAAASLTAEEAAEAERDAEAAAARDAGFGELLWMRPIRGCVFAGRRCAVLGVCSMFLLAPPLPWLQWPSARQTCFRSSSALSRGVS